MKYPICKYMQGDWLIPYGKDKPDQVRTVDYQEEMSGAWCVITFQNDRHSHYYPYDCQPIPLSSEILRKVGFINTQFYAEMLIDDWQIQCDCRRLKARNMAYEINIPCAYVHQLQHALRLCGIEKTIEL